MVRAGNPPGGEALEPPEGEIPGLVPDERVLSRTRDIVISAGQVAVYSSGFSVKFSVRFRPGWSSLAEATEELHLHLRGDRHPSPTRLILGVVDESNGAVDASVDLPEFRQSSAEGPRLATLPGSGKGRLWVLNYWLSPLPEADVAFFARWTLHRLDFGSVTFSAAELGSAWSAIQHVF